MIDDARAATHAEKHRPGGPLARRGAVSGLDIIHDTHDAPTRPKVPALNPGSGGVVPPGAARGCGRVRVAVLSFLFNWPSTGGGTVHTFELARSLVEAGYDVRHIYAKFEPWGIGGVAGRLPYPAEALEFDERGWDAPAIRGRFQKALDAFDPDRVIITDSWNSKPALAEASADYPYILRFQASECLCPLNNVRLLPGDGRGQFVQCANHQLASPETCMACLSKHEWCSGSLHRAERALFGVGTVAYHEGLLAMFRGALATLVVNPLMEAMVGPYTPSTRVVTAGMDPSRFPDTGPPPPIEGRPFRLLFAGLVDEPMKGYDVLRRACERLLEARDDFELVVTAEPPEHPAPFARFVGWQSQEDLPARIAESDLVIVPTVAQEALGRTAVEAMAGARPVVASRIGGLNFTVQDGATGVLVEPNDPEALASAIAGLLDDPEARSRMGLAGRRRFLDHYAWPVIIDRHYRPLLARRADDPRPEDGFVPVFAAPVDIARLAPAVGRFFGISGADVARMYRPYLAFHRSQGYARTLGEFKTLCLDEAFILCVTLSIKRPRVILAIESQRGRPVRRILDMAGFLGLNCRVVAFGEPGEALYYGPDEVELIQGGPVGGVAGAVERHQPDLIYLDRHEYALVDEVVGLGLSSPKDLVVAIHDCGPGLCNPSMTLAPDDPRVTSASGVWQRHVLAGAFGLDDPLDPGLDEVETAAHRLAVFETTHGLALLARRDGLRDRPSPGRPAG